MSQGRMAVAAVFALALALAACGGSGGDSASDAPATAQAAPTSAPTAAPTSAVEITAPEPAAESTPDAPAAAAEPSVAAAPANEPAADVDTPAVLRGIGEAFWEAYNAYDVEATLAFMEDAYREERRDTVSSSINLYKLFGSTVDVHDWTEAVEIGPGVWELYNTISTPLGDRRSRIEFKDIGGEWKITFADTVDE